MKNRNIIMTAADHAELGHATPSLASRPDVLVPHGRGSKDESARAQIVAPEEIPADVITMNNRAKLLALDTGERRVFTLAFPSDANLKDRTVSVLAPLATAMLGRRAGDEFKWVAPGGLRRLKVVHVHCQPETALRIGRRPPAVGRWDYCLSLRKEAPPR